MNLRAVRISLCFKHGNFIKGKTEGGEKPVVYHSPILGMSLCGLYFHTLYTDTVNSLCIPNSGVFFNS